MLAIRQFLLFALFTAVSVTGALAQDAVGSITAGSGEIVVIGSAGNEQPGSVGTEIQQYDTIYVGEGGAATVTFVDQTTLVLGASSALTVDELVYSPGGQDSSALFTLAGGVMGLVSGDILKSGDMTVTTPVSTIGIRGTGVMIDSGTTITLNDDGGFTVTTTTDTGESVSLVLSPDGTVGVVTVTNIASGDSATLEAFGETVITSITGLGAPQVKSTLTGSQLKAKYGPILAALQAAYGLDLSNSDNATEALNLQNALQDLLDTVEENPNTDVSPN